MCVCPANLIVKTIAGIALLTSCSQPANAVLIGSGFSIEQLDFDYFGGAFQEDSTWGRYTVDPVVLFNNTGISSGYINMNIDAIGWAIQNLYVDSADRKGLITSYFDLGLDLPSEVASLNVSVDFSSDPTVLFSNNQFSNVNVGKTFWATGGVGDPLTMIEEPFAAGSVVFDPAGQTEVLASQSIEPNVQCATNQCFPMSIANSLQFLENTHPRDFIVPNDHVVGLRGDNSLVGQLDTLSNRNV